MSTSILWEEPTGQGWAQVGELAVAFVLSSAIGLEREIRQKAAGLRTYTIVGLGAALFVLVSKYGFTDVLRPDLVVLDPSRVAAQIVSGLGFIGAGVIFMRRDSVRGLTTAAALWLTAGVGAAAGAGLGLLRTVLDVCTGAGFFVASFSGGGHEDRRERHEAGEQLHTVEVPLTLTGRGDANALTEHLVATPGIVTVAYDRANDDEYS
ncbi:putative Mg2+ transporter-C (MgtC) family protein [Catenulispora sp. GP43]|uniref:MgtC/SapB family protein n=1 Tax=Catenulispora sp. GP43 TaxID=3156263 RepID=UPI003517E606